MLNNVLPRRGVLQPHLAGVPPPQANGLGDPGASSGQFDLVQLLQRAATTAQQLERDKQLVQARKDQVSSSATSNWYRRGRTR